MNSFPYSRERGPRTSTMGFTCYICFESFDEASPATEKGGGDGHGEAKARTVSALIKCGHAFHTECLKRKFETQSGNGINSAKF